MKSIEIIEKFGIKCLNKDDKKSKALRIVASAFLLKSVTNDVETAKKIIEEIYKTNPSDFLQELIEVSSCMIRLDLHKKLLYIWKGNPKQIERFI